MEYINQIVNKINFETNEILVSGVCESAAIYGQDGAAWAWSPAFPELAV